MIASSAATDLADARSEELSDTAWRTDNIGRLMFAATDLFVQDKLSVLDGGGVVESEAMMALVLHLDPEGSRLTTLAARAGQTKQSMIELVNKAEASGIVERRADGSDLRAKIVAFTRHGLDVLALLERGIVEAERRFADSVGEAFLGQLKDAFALYLDLPEQDGGGAHWRRRNAGRLLSLSARRFAQDVLWFVHERGCRDVTEVLLALFRNLDDAGTRLTDLAARARMTKQSMRELVDRAEALGLVERRPDPQDRRAKIVAFTPEGVAMLREMRRGVTLAEDRFARLVGSTFAAALRTKLAHYLAVRHAPWKADNRATARRSAPPRRR